MEVLGQGGHRNKTIEGYSLGPDPQIYLLVANRSHGSLSLDSGTWRSPVGATEEGSFLLSRGLPGPLDIQGLKKTKPSGEEKWRKS